MTVAFGFSLALVGCGPDGNGTYCQSGPKYGTQCYGSTGTGTNNPQGPSQPPQEQPAPPAYR